MLSLETAASIDRHAWIHILPADAPEMIGHG